MASIGTGMAQRKWTSEWFFNICCARNYLRSDQYVFFALQYSVVYGPKNSNGAVMCPTSIVYSKHSNRSVAVLYGKRKKKTLPSTTPTHTGGPWIPCLGNAALQKVWWSSFHAHRSRGTEYLGPNLWWMPHSWALSTGLMMPPICNDPPACVVSTAVYIIPHTVVNFFPSPIIQLIPKFQAWTSAPRSSDREDFWA